MPVHLKISNFEGRESPHGFLPLGGKIELNGVDISNGVTELRITMLPQSHTTAEIKFAVDGFEVDAVSLATLHAIVDNQNP